jgi:predicted transcriptional regulator
MSQACLINLENNVSKILDLLQILVPATFTLSYISNTTGVSRDTINKFLKRNYMEGIDYKNKDGKIVISREVGLELLRRYQNAT